MSEQEIVSWSSELPRFGDLANLILRYDEPDKLSVTLEELSSHNQYTLSFEQVLGFRFQNAFSQRRLATSFKVLNSAWIASMKRQRFLCTSLDTAQHYMISSYEGEVEIVTSVEPTIEVKSGKLNNKTVNVQEEIISELAITECRRISQDVIQSLGRMTDGMQSGDDSSLESVWEEICVQVQAESSLVWDWYSETIESLIQEQVLVLSVTTQRAIWLQTEEGMDWCIDGEQQSSGAMMVSLEGITRYIMETFLLPIASSQINPRIERYLERGMDE